MSKHTLADESNIICFVLITELPSATAGASGCVLQGSDERPTDSG